MLAALLASAVAMPVLAQDRAPEDAARTHSDDIIVTATPSTEQAIAAIQRTPGGVQPATGRAVFGGVRFPW